MTTTPPRPQSPLGVELAKHMQADKLILQVCADCGAVQYPPRERCLQCLGDALPWREIENQGRVIALSELHHSLEPFFQDHAPVTLASVRLDCGITILAFGDGTLRLNQRTAIGGESSLTRFGFRVAPLGGGKER